MMIRTGEGAEWTDNPQSCDWVDAPRRKRLARADGSSLFRNHDFDTWH